MSKFSISGVVVEVRSNVAKTRPKDDTAASRGLNVERIMDPSAVWPENLVINRPITDN